MPILSNLVKNSLFKSLMESCRQMAKVDLTSINCKKLAESFINVPIVYLYSKRDEMVVTSDSMKVYGSLSSHFKIFVDSNVKHNQKRPEKKIKKVFLELEELKIKKQKRRKKSRSRNPRKPRKSPRTLSKRSVAHKGSVNSRNFKKTAKSKNFSLIGFKPSKLADPKRDLFAKVKKKQDNEDTLWESDLPPGQSQLPVQNYDSVTNFFNEIDAMPPQHVVSGQNLIQAKMQSLKSNKVYLNFENEKKESTDAIYQSEIVTKFSTKMSLKKTLNEDSELFFGSHPKTSIIYNRPRKSENQPASKYIAIPTKYESALPGHKTLQTPPVSSRKHPFWQTTKGLGDNVNAQFTQSSSNLSRKIEQFRNASFHKKNKLNEKHEINDLAKVFALSKTTNYTSGIKRSTSTIQLNAHTSPVLQRTTEEFGRKVRAPYKLERKMPDRAAIAKTPERQPRIKSYRETQRTYISQPKRYIRDELSEQKTQRSGRSPCGQSKRPENAYGKYYHPKNVSVTKMAKNAVPKERFISTDLVGDKGQKEAMKWVGYKFIKNTFPLNIKQNYILNDSMNQQAFTKKVNKTVYLSTKKEKPHAKLARTETQKKLDSKKFRQVYQLDSNLSKSQHQASKIQKSRSISKFLQGDKPPAKSHFAQPRTFALSPSPQKKSPHLQRPKLRFVSNNMKPQNKHLRLESTWDQPWKPQKRQGEIENTNRQGRLPRGGWAKKNEHGANNDIKRISDNIQRHSRHNWTAKKNLFGDKFKKKKQNYSAKTYKFS